MQGGYLYAIVFDYDTGPSNVTEIYRYNLDLTGATFIADISADVGNGGNGLYYKDGYWLVGETGGTVTDFDQHVFIFNGAWVLQKSIDIGYNQGLGIQGQTFIDDIMYAMEHNSDLLRLTWDLGTVDLTLTDEDALYAGYYEGITYDTTRNRFYIYDRIQQIIVTENTLP